MDTLSAEIPCGLQIGRTRNCSNKFYSFCYISRQGQADNSSTKS